MNTGRGRDDPSTGEKSLLPSTVGRRQRDGTIKPRYGSKSQNQYQSGSRWRNPMASLLRFQRSRHLLVSKMNWSPFSRTSNPTIQLWVRETGVCRCVCVCVCGKRSSSRLEKSPWSPRDVERAFWGSSLAIPSLPLLQRQNFSRRIKCNLKSKMFL